MATNHTEHYNLNLWEPSDKFVRAEFNENSQKIDAALAGKTDTEVSAALRTDLTTVQNKLPTAGPYRLVAETAAASGAKQLNLSLSGVNVFDYYKFELFLDCPGACGRTCLRLNGRADKIYAPTGGGNGGSSLSSLADYLILWPSDSGQPPAGLVSFTTPMAGGNVTCFGHCCCGTSSSIQYALSGGTTYAVKWENLTTINIVCENAFPAGSKAALYGLHK